MRPLLSMIRSHGALRYADKTRGRTTGLSESAQRWGANGRLGSLAGTPPSSQPTR